MNFNECKVINSPSKRKHISQVCRSGYRRVENGNNCAAHHYFNLALMSRSWLLAVSCAS